MWVVKLGGSLAASPELAPWLDVLASHGGGKVVLVPGGGRFADLVRAEQVRSGIDDAAAHWMAILAMEQYGFLLAAQRPRLRCAATRAEIMDVLAAGALPVWLAYPMVAGDRTLPRNWSVTADSLALWLAMELEAEALVLLKSVAPVLAAADFETLSREGHVDEYFPGLATRYQRPIRLLGPGMQPLLRESLSRGSMPDPDNRQAGREC